MAALIPHLQPNVQFPMELLSAQVATGDLDGALPKNPAEARCAKH
jgi:hypothetical protein